MNFGNAYRSIAGPIILLKSNYCYLVGWGHHMICNRRYHLVVPSKETLMPEVAHSRCKGSEAAAMMNWVELKGHLMHGLIHSNGFGHLLSLNGIETGSDFLNGHQIMDLWDRICTALRARYPSIHPSIHSNLLDQLLVINFCSLVGAPQMTCATWVEPNSNLHWLSHMKF